MIPRDSASQLGRCQIGELEEARARHRLRVPP